MATNVAVKQGKLVFSGVGYFRGHAEEVELGSIGEKRTPIGKMNYLDVKDQLPLGTVKKGKSRVVDIDVSKTTKGAFKRDVRVAAEKQTARLSASGAFTKLMSGEYKLVKLSIDNDPVMKAANSSPAALRRLKDWGNKARIVDEIFVVMKAKTAESFGWNAEVNVDIAVTADGVSVSGKSRSSAGGSKSTKVELSTGMTFAYLLAKITWNAKQKRKQKKIVDLDMDQKGLG